MIDEMVVYNPVTLPQMRKQIPHQTIEVFGVTCYINTSKYGIKYKGHHRNMSITVGVRGVRIEGSPHTYHFESNHTDFTVSQLKDSILELDDWSNGFYSNSEIKKIAIGVNVENVLWSNWMKYRQKDFVPMLSKGREYGKKMFQQRKNIKVYDKGYEVYRQKKIKLGRQITRIELNLTHKAEIEPKGIVKPKDLLNPKIQNVCGSLLINHVKQVQLKPSFIYSELSTKEKRAICTMLNNDHEFKREVKNDKWYQRDRALYNKMVKAKTMCSKIQLLRCVHNKTEMLLNN